MEYDINNTISVLQLAVHPDVVTISSDDGPASSAQYSRMGLFKKSTTEINGHPMWSNHDDSQKIFYSSGTDHSLSIFPFGTLFYCVVVDIVEVVSLSVNLLGQILTVA
jgi:hypothetical protein